MPDLDGSLAGVRAAVAEFLVAADRAAVHWTVPRAPGKWSPSRTLEHVARIMEESANVAAGTPSKFPPIPFVLRPIVRHFFFRRTLRRNGFLNMKGSDAFDPEDGPPNPAEGRRRLNGALGGFERACRTRAAAGGKVPSSIFGRVPVADFARFQELHVRHHRLQLRPPA